MVVKDIIKKLISGKWFPFYNSFFARAKLRQNVILLESRGALSVEGNILRMMIELQKAPYRKYHKVLAYKKGNRQRIQKRLELYGVKDVELVRYASVSYYYFLSVAKYLVNDTSFPGRFVKKEGQIYLNTWHGTPLKRMGRDNVDEICTMGNVERNLIQADFLLFPNKYMQERMCQAYMLDNLAQGTILQEGYPRNSVFFDTNRAQNVRHALGYDKKQIIVYMPTFRGRVDQLSVQEQIEQTQLLLHEMDDQLRDDQLLVVNFHPFLRQGVKLDAYEHISNAPEEYDIYDILNASDVLITDYSSVFYDYAVTDKKIILFTYDEREYAAQRGIYENLDGYPFPKVATVHELMVEISHPQIMPRETFRQQYDTYENADAVSRICQHVFLGMNACRTCRPEGNGRQNVLIYAGDLNKNGITTALNSMMSGLDKERFNYYIAFRKSVLEQHPERLQNIPKGCGVIPMATDLETDGFTLAAHMLYFRFHLHWGWIKKKLDTQYTREWRKHFGNIEFRHVIHYNGYERYVIALFQRYSGVRTIWVHNDMEQEIRNRAIQSYHQLHDAYREYDHVVVVSEDIAESTIRISGRKDNVMVIGNCHQYEQVRHRAEMPLEFQSDTCCNCSMQHLQKVLENDCRKFINIGRFSVEKGHKRLIQAFTKYWLQHKNTYLIIIGGTGDLYESTLQWVKESPAADFIIVIKSIQNPMPILKRCQLFILSSLYEGLGLVLLEADTLDVPVVSCNITGPRGLMMRNGGTLVEDSEDGILHAMNLYDEGKISCMHIDYEKMNAENIKKIENLI